MWNCMGSRVEEGEWRNSKLVYVMKNSKVKKILFFIPLMILSVVLYGQTIRLKDRWGTALYYLDGNTLRQKDRWGAAVYYFDFTPELWQLVCVILM